MIQLVIKYSGGFIKDETQANYALIGIVVLAIVVSLLLILEEILARREIRRRWNRWNKC